MAGHVTAESSPPALRGRRRVLAPPSNVIKAAEPGGAPVLEAPLELECSPQEPGGVGGGHEYTCAILVHVAATVHPQRLLPGLPVSTRLPPLQLNWFPAASAAGSGSSRRPLGSVSATRKSGTLRQHRQ